MPRTHPHLKLYLVERPPAGGRIPVLGRALKPTGGTPVPPATAGKRGMGVPPMSPPGKRSFKN